jgi:hypothetical protein
MTTKNVRIYSQPLTHSTKASNNPQLTIAKIRATEHEYLKRKTDEIASNLPAKRVSRRADGTLNPFSTNGKRRHTSAAQTTAQTVPSVTLAAAPQPGAPTLQLAASAATQPTQAQPAQVSDEQERDVEAEAPQDTKPAVDQATYAQQKPAVVAEEHAVEAPASQSAIHDGGEILRCTKRGRRTCTSCNIPMHEAADVQRLRRERKP